MTVQKQFLDLVDQIVVQDEAGQSMALNHEQRQVLISGLEAVMVEPAEVFREFHGGLYDRHLSFFTRRKKVLKTQKDWDDFFEPVFVAHQGPDRLTDEQWRVLFSNIPLLLKLREMVVQQETDYWSKKIKFHQKSKSLDEAWQNMLFMTEL